MSPVLWIVLGISFAYGLENHMKDGCISGFVFLSKNNFSMSKDYENNFTEDVNENEINYNKWSQVINDNKTGEFNDLPHNHIPEISKYEKSELKLLSRV